MLDLYVKYGQRLPSEAGEVEEDIVVAAYAPGTPIVIDRDHPGCVYLPYDGALDDLPRIGPPRPHGTFDMRQRRAPTRIDLAAYADRQWLDLMTHGAVFNVAAEGAAPIPILCDGTNDTRADLALLVQFGIDTPEGTRTWTDNEGVATVLTGEQLIRLARLAGMWVSSSYPFLTAIKAEVASGAITTPAQIDARFAAYVG